MDSFGFLIFAACFMGVIWWLTRLMTSNGRNDGGTPSGGAGGPAGF